MALTDDQKAMLRLLAQREHGYDDIAALTGKDVADVRAGVREAIAALDRPEGPSAGQRAMLRMLAQQEHGYADIGALTGDDVDGVRGKVAAALAALEGDEAAAPPPEPPPRTEPAPTPAKPRREPEKAPASPPSPPKSARARGARPEWLKFPKDRRVALGLGAGLIVVLIFVVLLATGTIGGGSDSGGDKGQASKSGLKPTRAVLKPVGGRNGKGLALFGREGKKVVLLLSASGLDPSPKGRSYTVSLAKSASEKLPLVATRVTSSGRIEGRFPVAPQVLGLLASGYDTMEIALVDDSELSAALKAAKTARKAPDYKGEVFLRGAVVGAIVEAGEQGTVKP